MALRASTSFFVHETLPVGICILSQLYCMVSRYTIHRTQTKDLLIRVVSKEGTYLPKTIYQKFTA